MRRKNRRQINLHRSGVREELLSPNLLGHLEMIMTTFTPGAGTGDEGRERKGEEGGVLLSGELELKADGQTILLEAGDSFQLSGKGPIWCHNPGNTDTIIVWSFSQGKF